MKTFFRNVVIAIFSFIVLTTCNNPFAPKEEEGTFVITIGASGNGRAVTDYPPKGVEVDGVTGGDDAPELKDLKFSVTFTPTANSTGTLKTFAEQGKLSISGTVPQGDYVVTAKVKLGDEPYAQGCAVDNPVHIKGGNNSIKVWVFSVDVAEMPKISAKPQAATYAVNGIATPLSVIAEVTDGGSLSYEWYSTTTAPTSNDPLGKPPLSCTPIGGATSASYTPSTATAGTTYYYVEVTNTKGGNATKITSGPAAVVVSNDAQTPNITTQPANVSISTNGTTTLTVVASVTDGGSLSYQWFKNGTASNSGGTHVTGGSGATTASYTTPSLANGTYHYYCVVTNTNNSVGGNKVVTKASNAATVTVSSAYIGPAGTGTSTDPFIVHDVETLKRVGKGTNAAWTGNWSLDAFYKQVRNITLPTVAAGESNWTPIGNVQYFTGSYDGGGFIISNLTLNKPNDDEQGLFGKITGTSAIVKNVGIVNCNISGKQYVGGVAGVSFSTVQYCYVTGNVSGGVSGGFLDVGGVVGNNYGIVEYCYVTGNVSGGAEVGGVVGSNTNFNNNTKVLNCYVTGNVSGSNVVGGVVGSNKEAIVQNCYATGNVSGGVTYAASGVAGNNSGTVENCAALNSNIVFANSSTSGRVANIYDAGTLASNYGRSNMKKNGASNTWTPTGDTTVNGADITSAQWNNASWWTGTAGFDTNVWNITNGSLPTLKNMPAGTQNPTVQ